MWNFPKFLFPSFLCSNLLIQILWLCFISIGKEDWARVTVLCLQLWIYISMFRSRTNIQMLTEDLCRISNMLHARTLQKKTMKICIWLYGLFVISGAAFLVTIFRSGNVFRVAADDPAFSCSCQSSCGDGEGNCSVVARLVSKAVQHHKVTCM
ncbi:hypothetical protein CEXT_369221 [Caerostris extrusa]|uniref:Uncharacterized protein n=1 Tax=Caerostris extrusa TaxID=172846 RepID=A0AAV4XGR7_CAEEX|nr:hypothetical protein CEXT_369221 [Caerostris extrusa]